jgi:hypothetical protein
MRPLSTSLCLIFSPFFVYGFGVDLRLIADWQAKKIPDKNVGDKQFRRSPVKRQPKASRPLERDRRGKTHGKKIPDISAGK